MSAKSGSSSIVCIQLGPRKLSVTKQASPYLNFWKGMHDKSFLVKANSVDVRCPGYIRGESNTKIFKQGGWREASLWRVHNVSHFNVLRSRDFWSTHAQIKYLLCCTSMKLLGEWRIWYRAMSSPYLCWRQPSYYIINIDKEKKRTNHWSMWVSGLCWRLSSIYGNILCSVGQVTGDARPKNS